MTKRKFTGAKAERASIPLWIGLYGPSGAGKTYSALRLAKGIQSVCGGKIAVGDTENGRSLHYVGDPALGVEFYHYPFDPPFDSLSYLALLEQMSQEGVTVAIVDSASHEHEGIGGHLELHQQETDRLVKEWKTTRNKAQRAAWALPKATRKKLILGAQRLNMHVIWCFRAKEKLDWNSSTPKELGFMPLAGEGLVYEMDLTALLLPGAKGRPTWQSKEIGEKMMIKTSEWAKGMLRNEPLDERFGAELAQWAKGGAPAESPTDERAKVLEAIKAEMVAKHPGKSPDDKEGRKAMMHSAFGMTSWSEIQELPLEDLRNGLALLQYVTEESGIARSGNPGSLRVC